MGKVKTLETIAHDAMIERGFIPGFSKTIEEELAHMQEAVLPQVKDLRRLHWVSIDNEDSKDLDQLTYAEEGRIFVAIADVDSLVKKGSFIDKRASHNTTSVYTPAKVFPMLPLKLSNDLTSLNEKTDRSAIVVEMNVAEDGAFSLHDLYPALVRNQAKLNYPSVGAWLERQTPAPAGLEKQLFLQDALARKILAFRAQKGALEFGVLELQATLSKGVPISLERRQLNRAHRLIENFMIAANVAATHYLMERQYPTFRRVVKTPKRWDRIVVLARGVGEILPPKPDPKALRALLRKQQKEAPLTFPDLSLSIIKLLGRGEYVLGLPNRPIAGHFDLAEHEYCHTTAPNRRFPDLIMQRLLKSSLFSLELPYNKKELEQLALHCTAKETDADKVQRRLIKCAAAMLLQKEIGKTFDALCTGAAPKGTWVRLVDPPVEGKLVKGFQGIDVGDVLKVKLLHVDVLKGHIDFAAIDNKIFK